MKKDYVVTVKISVMLPEYGRTASVMEFVVYAEDDYEAILELTKKLTLEIVKNTHRCANETKWKYCKKWGKAFDFEIDKIYSVTPIERMGA